MVEVLYEWILVEIVFVVFERKVGHFERKFQGNRGRPPTTVGVRKLESLGAITWRDLTFSRFGTVPACDGRTDGHTTTAYTAQAWRRAVMKLNRSF